eukprot:Ihof_evm4s261 gene=Ihof_evmTU4s261
MNMFSLKDLNNVDPKTVALMGTLAILPILHYALRKPSKKELGPRPEGSEIIIVGGGVLGATLATVLARDGRKVTMIERDFSVPDRIVGELLQPGGLDTLKELGMGETITGIDEMMKDGYVMYYGDRQVHLMYPKDEKTGQQHQGVAFHHGPFVNNLRNVCKKESNVTCIEGTVTQLIYNSTGDQVTGVTYKTKGGEVVQLEAPLTVVADGCFSKFRKELCRNSAEVPSRFYGLILKDAPLEYPGRAIVCLTKPFPVLAYEIGKHDLRVLVDLPESAGVTSPVEYMRETITPQLPLYLQASFLEALDRENPRMMPNSYLPAAPLVRKGVLCLGDAMNMRHPLTGGGMTVVFKDVQLWREYIRGIPDLRDTDAVMASLKDFQVQRKSNYSFSVNVMANALYLLFSASDDRLAVLRDGCFKYFELGGDCVDGPISLLSALHLKPLRLMNHFFSVAAYGSYAMIKEN